MAATVATMPCLTCSILDRTQTSPGGILWRSATVFVNHHGTVVTDSGTVDRAGWIIVCPTRHVTRLFELAPDEIAELFDVAAAVAQHLPAALARRHTNPALAPAA